MKFQACLILILGLACIVQADDNKKKEDDCRNECEPNGFDWKLRPFDQKCQCRIKLISDPNDIKALHMRFEAARESARTLKESKKCEKFCHEKGFDGVHFGWCQCLLRQTLEADDETSLEKRMAEADEHAHKIDPYDCYVFCDIRGLTTGHELNDKCTCDPDLGQDLLADTIYDRETGRLQDIADD